MEKTQAIAYLRVSGKGQIDGDGFERQREAISGFAASAGFEIVGEFREEGVSGTTELEDRPALADALARIAGNGVRVVLVERADRLARELLTQESIIRLFMKLGARIVTADGFDLTDDEEPSRKMIRQILGAVAEFEKRTLVAKLRAARKRQKARTGRSEGRKPFGSRPGERAILDRVQALRSEGLTFGAITKRLNAEGVRTRAGRVLSEGVVFQYHVVAERRKEA